VDTLFIALDARRPGTFDRARNQAVITGEMDAAEADLLDLAVRETVRHDGRVYALESRAVPARDAAAAAILRF
jgi:hypothetical protein